MSDLQKFWIGKEPERGKGYGKQGLGLLLDRAFNVDGVSCLHNDFEETRSAAYSIHKAVGFKKIGRADGIISLEITKEDYFHHEKIFYGKDNEDKKNY